MRFFFLRDQDSQAETHKGEGQREPKTIATINLQSGFVQMTHAQDGAQTERDGRVILQLKVYSAWRAWPMWTLKHRTTPPCVSQDKLLQP